MPWLRNSSNSNESFRSIPQEVDVPPSTKRILHQSRKHKRTIDQENTQVTPSDLWPEHPLTFRVNQVPRWEIHQRIEFTVLSGDSFAFTRWPTSSVVKMAALLPDVTLHLDTFNSFSRLYLWLEIYKKIIIKYSNSCLPLRNFWNFFVYNSRRNWIINFGHIPVFPSLDAILTVFNDFLHLHKSFKNYEKITIKYSYTFLSLSNF